MNISPIKPPAPIFSPPPYRIWSVPLSFVTFTQPPTPREAQRLRTASLCTGYGGLDLAAIAVLGARRPGAPRPAGTPPPCSRSATRTCPRGFGDIARLDWAGVPPVDVVTAGFPGQDISFAGRGAGLAEGTRSSVWTHAAAAIRHLQPGLVLVENVAALCWPGRGMDRVIRSLAAAGLDSVWCCVRASDTGAPHHRARVFIAAYPPSTRPPRSSVPASPPGRRPPGQPQRHRLLTGRPHRPGHQLGAV
ncbi:MAG TPA: DNA cytosine methyltransferase [Streptosporangiaceae bacterium]